MDPFTEILPVVYTYTLFAKSKLGLLKQYGFMMVRIHQPGGVKRGALQNIRMVNLHVSSCTRRICHISPIRLCDICRLMKFLRRVTQEVVGSNPARVACEFFSTDTRKAPSIQ